MRPRSPIERLQTLDEQFRGKAPLIAGIAAARGLDLSAADLGVLCGAVDSRTLEAVWNPRRPGRRRPPRLTVWSRTLRPDCVAEG